MKSKQKRVYIELSDSLVEKELIEEILIVSFLGEKMLLVRKGKVHRFPLIKLEQGESIEKTVRRELYYQTGALLKTGQLLGLLRFGDEQVVPIYVGLISHLEKPVLKNDFRKRVCDIDVAYEKLTQDYWQKTKSFLFYHAYKLAKQIEREER